MVQEQELREKNFDESTFLGGWFIPENICDELLDYFIYNKKYQINGLVGSGEGMVLKKEVKDSIDLPVSAGNFDGIIGEYRNYLQQCLENYTKKYVRANQVAHYQVREGLNIQKYPKGGGYKEWHAEISGAMRSVRRHLVFMTYLNDVEDGGTEFMYQNILTKAEKGLTLIWPAPWTHTHRGIVSNTKEKYIMTGWYSFIEGENND